MAGMRCPLGAHYLPVPGRAAHEVDRRCSTSSACVDDRARPRRLRRADALPQPAGAAVHRRRLARRPAAADRGAAARPSARRRSPTTAPSAPPSPSSARRRLRDPDRTLALERRRSTALDAPHLRRLARRPRPRPRRRCAGTSTTAAATTTAPAAAHVSAWAGLHYFASRHGFRAPDDDARCRPGRRACSPGPRATPGSPSGWPRRSASGCMPAASFSPSTKGATTSPSMPGMPWRASASFGRAPRVVMATPLFVAARLLAAPPEALREAAAAGSPRALAGGQPAARRGARRSAGRAALVGQRRLRQRAGSATSTRCTRARARSPGRPC